MSATSDEVATSPWAVAAVVAMYWFVSISLVFINKILLTGASTIFFITWTQCIVTCFICWICGLLGEKMRRGMAETKDHEPPSKLAAFLLTFPKAEYKPALAVKVLPLSVIFVIMILFNQLTLGLVEVSFYNVVRSLTIVCNAILSAVILKSRISFRTVCCLGIVIIGFIVGVRGEGPKRAGVVCGVVSSVAVSLNSIYTKKALSHVKNDAWLLTFNNNANACLLFPAIVLYFERTKLIETYDMFTPVFMGCVVMSGVLGFMIGIVTVMQIRFTSPLTHNISGTAKAATQSALAYAYWQNEVTIMACLGIFLVLFGSSLYTAVKIWEVEKVAPTPSKASLLPK